MPINNPSDTSSAGTDDWNDDGSYISPKLSRGIGLNSQPIKEITNLTGSGIVSMGSGSFTSGTIFTLESTKINATSGTFSSGSITNLFNDRMHSNSGTFLNINLTSGSFKTVNISGTTTSVDKISAVDFRANSGSATAPAYTFTSDTDTGMFLNGTSISVTNGGSTTATFNPSFLQIINGELNSFKDVTTTEYTLLQTDRVLGVSYTTSGTVDITLDLAVNLGGSRFTIKDTGLNAGNNNITLIPNGSRTIDGLSTYVINTNGQSVDIIGDGVNWFIL